VTSTTRHVYEVQPRKDHPRVDLISDALLFGRLWYEKAPMPSITRNSTAVQNNSSKAYSGREFVDRSVVVIASMNGGAVKVSELIDDDAVIGKASIWRALEGMNHSLGPLTAGNRT